MNKKKPPVVPTTGGDTAVALLSDVDRQAVWADLMRRVLGAGLTKAQLRAAVDAADTWADANSAAYNLALPLVARNALSAGDKAILLAAVVTKRQEKGA
jgi:hypothetical protein